MADNRNNRSRKRSSNNNRGRNNNNNRGRNNNNRKQTRGNRGGNRNSRTPQSKLGGRDPVDSTAGNIEGPLHVNAFELFCAYHLGITPNNRYKKPNIHDVARYFDRKPHEIKDALAACGLDNVTCNKVDFEFKYAQLDIRVAPEGLDLREIARPLFDEFVELNENFVDWSEPKINYSSDDEDEEE